MTLIAFILAVLYQVFMLGIYLSGYKYTATHMDNSTIVYVNQDGAAGKKLVNSLSSGMNFKSKHVKTVKAGEQALKDHDAVLVINVPKHYSENLAAGKKAHFNFYVNSAGDQISSKTGDSVASGLTDKVNKAITSKKMMATLSSTMLAAAKPQIDAQVQAAVSADPTLSTDSAKFAATQQQITQQFTQKIDKQAKSMAELNNVSSSMTDINTKSTNMNKLMAPMMVGLAGFVAAMTCSSILFSSFTKEAKRKGKNKWKAFWGLEIIYLGVSAAAAIASSLMVVLINGIAPLMALQLFGISFTLTFASFQLLNVTNLLFGALSMIVNIPLVLVQAISSGSVMSVPVMLPFYRFVRQILPVPSAWQLNMDVLFGTNTSTNPGLHLVMIGVISLAISLILVFVKFRKSAPEPALATEAEESPSFF